MIRDFERWPKYKEGYIRAFEKMIKDHDMYTGDVTAKGKKGGYGLKGDDIRKDAERIMDWWLQLK